MNTLFSQLSSNSMSILLKYAHSIVGNSSFHSIYSNILCKSSIIIKFNVNNVGSSALSRFGLMQYCYSTTTTTTKKGTTRKRKPKPEPKPVMQDETDAYFVARKGDVVGIFKSLSDCQALVGSSICDPPVSVYKGYSIPNEAEEHLVSRGLQNALYTIKASDLKDDLFGTLTPCPFQEPASSTGETSSTDSPKRPHDGLDSENLVILVFFGVLSRNYGAVWLEGFRKVLGNTPFVDVWCSAVAQESFYPEVNANDLGMEPTDTTRTEGSVLCREQVSLNFFYSYELFTEYIVYKIG
ncbi:hypothetical protein KSS87_007352, partial [Heliosperma pusillum]